MAENQKLQRLIRELEYLIQLSSQHVHVSKKRIYYAKDIMNVSSCQMVTRNESKKSNETLCSCRDGQAQISFQDEDDLLEEEIKRILQIAENVRDKAMSKHNQRSKVIYSSCADKKITRIAKSEATCSPGVKEPALRSRFAPTGVKSGKKTGTKSDIRTVYQKDFSLTKSKSMPSLCSSSQSNDVIKCRTLERNSYHQDKKMGVQEPLGAPKACCPPSMLSHITQKVDTQSKAVGLYSKQYAPKSNKDFIKINKQNLGLVKKEVPRDNRNRKGVSELTSKLLQSSKVNEALLCEELALRSQLPKHNEILMMLREVHLFSTGSNRKAGKKEVVLRENFIERCNSSASKCDSEPELLGILNILLPHCGWVFGRNEIKTAKDLRIIKHTITELEEKLHSIQFSLKFNQNNVHNSQPELICVQKNSENQENMSLKESPFWHPLVMSSVFQGVEMPPYLYYKNACEWISFQNSVLELHEYYIQLKVLESIHPIITEVLGSIDSENATAGSNADWITLLAQLLKAAAVMADFTGHLTVPILAGLKSVNESPPNHFS